MLLLKSLLPIPFAARTSALKILKRNITFKYQRPEPITACTKALQYFDDYYKSIFKHNWHSIRLGLLSNEKKVAVINNFGDVNEVKDLLECQGAYDLRPFLEHQKKYLQGNGSQIKSSYNKKNNFISSTIEEKVKLTEESEWNEIYSPDKNIPVKSKGFESNECKSSEEEKENDFVYDPEETKTSLKADVTNASIDENRLILPSSNREKSSLYEFVPATKLRGMDHYISEAEYFKYYLVKNECKIDVELECNINFPENLLVYTFDRGDTSEFLPPMRSFQNIYNYVLMNGADLLTVLALDIQPDETFLDVMSESGAQAFCVLQTLKSKMVTLKKNKDIETFFKNHLYDYSPNWKNMLTLSCFDWSKDEVNICYDKILLDICCTDDRESISNQNTNYFASVRKVDRLKLPSLQCALLSKALKSLKKNGALIYTTKTMCPVQNDGVVSEALKTVWEENKMKFCIKDLSPALEHTKVLFKYGDFIGLKYGTLILPFLPSNFGPRYIAKIVKLE